MEKDLQKINERNKIAFNPFFVEKINLGITSKNFSARTLENYVWFTASIPLLRNYYKVNKGMTNSQYDDNFQYFWANVPFDIRKMHTGIPSLATRTMSKLLIGNGIEISAEVFNKGAEGGVNAESTKNVQEVIDEIYESNNLYELMNGSIANESWSGSVAWKINIDKKFSKLPIIDYADARKVELLSKHKRITGIIFKDWYEYKDDKYELQEIYSTNENGDATITNILYKLNTDKLENVSLKAIPQTQDLEEEITLNGVKGMIAGFKPNRTPNNEFEGYLYGESDYAGCYSLFDSLDEIYSTMIDDVRRGRTIRFIPEDLMPKDNQGNVLPFDTFKLNYVKIEGHDASSLNDNPNSIDTSVPQTRTDEYINEWRSVLTSALNKLGLSPITIGVTGLESINSADNSQREREKTSLRTRDEKIKLWRPFLAKFTVQLLKVYQYMTSGDASVNGLSKIDVDESNLNIKVSFGEYFKIPFEERLNLYGTAHMNGSISIEEMVEQIYRDEKTEEQKKDEINRLKMEKGMNLDNISNDLIL